MTVAKRSIKGIALREVAPALQQGVFGWPDTLSTKTVDTVAYGKDQTVEPLVNIQRLGAPPDFE